MRTIQTQAQQTGVGITSYGHQTTRTNQFFSEQSQTISGVSDESQLVSFLYNLGSGNSLIRVRAISVRPDQVRQRLNSNVTLVASYQKTHAPPQPAASAAKVPRPQPAPPAAKSPPPPAKPADPRPPTAQKK
jgi:hypothetical protein